MRIDYYLPQSLEACEAPLQDLLEGLGHEGHRIDQAILEASLLEHWAGSAKPQSPPPPGPPVACLIFEETETEALQTLFSALRETPGLCPFPLKAVRTEENVHWPINTLFRHLAKEHQMMGILRQLHQALPHLRSMEDASAQGLGAAIEAALQDQAAVDDESRMLALHERMQSFF